jgi:cob(I)alamin adenosyltransferase
MNEARFMELLGAYGAELSRWPDDDRGDAEAFLEVAPHRIKDIWESERAFDHLLALEKEWPSFDLAGNARAGSFIHLARTCAARVRTPSANGACRNG